MKFHLALGRFDGMGASPSSRAVGRAPRSGLLRGTLAPIVAAVVAIGSFATPASASQHEPASGSGGVHTTVAVRISEAGRASGEVTVQIPLTAKRKRELAILRATPARFSKRYEGALEKVLGDSDVFPDQAQSFILSDLRALPRLEIAHREATLILTAPQPLLWYGDPSGHFTLERIRVARGETLDVIFRDRDGAPEAVNPLPTEDDGHGRLRWQFGYGRSPRLQVRGAAIATAAPFPTVTSRLRGAANFLVTGLPFLVLLALVMLERSSFRTYTALPRIAAVGALLSIACAFAFYYYLGFGKVFNGDGSLVRAAGASLLEVLIPALGLVAFVAFPAPFSRPRIVAVSLLSLLFAGLAYAGVAWGAEPLGLHLSLKSVQVAASCVIALLLIGLVIEAVARWLGDLAPVARGWWRNLGGARTGLILLGAIALVGAAQLVLAGRSTFPRIGFSDFSLGSLPSLAVALEGLPFQLAGLCRTLCLALLGVGLAGWLRWRAAEGEVPFSAWPECVALGLMFATAVIGLDGDVDGYAVPLAFLFSLASVSIGVRLLSLTALGKLAGDAAGRREAPRLLQESVELTVLRRKRQALEKKLSGNEIGDAEYDTQLAQINARRGELLQPVGAEETVAGVVGENRARRMLALGLAGPDGAAERFASLCREGWWALAVPMAYSAYALLHARAGSVFASHNELGVLALLASLFGQLLVWPVAAWCFILVMPILPGRVGPAKGLLAGVFCAIPPALASAFVKSGAGHAGWVFLFAELTLVFTAIGFVLDYHSMKREDWDLSKLGELYNITDLRSALVYLGPLAVVLIGVIQGLANGSGVSALQELATHSSSLVPPH